MSGTFIHDDSEWNIYVGWQWVEYLYRMTDGLINTGWQLVEHLYRMTDWLAY